MRDDASGLPCGAWVRRCFGPGRRWRNRCRPSKDRAPAPCALRLKGYSPARSCTFTSLRNAPIKIDVPGANSEVTRHWDFKFPVYRNGSAWAAQSIGPGNPGQEPNKAKVRWYEIDMNGWPVSQNGPELVQYGTINPGTSISPFYPAIHVDDDGNASIAWNPTSASDHVSIGRAIRKHYDDAGELRATLVLKESTGSPSASEPWADSSAVDEDPLEGFEGVMWSHLMWWDGQSTPQDLGRADGPQPVDAPGDLADDNADHARHVPDLVGQGRGGGQPGALVLLDDRLRIDVHPRPRRDAGHRHRRADRIEHGRR